MRSFLLAFALWLLSVGAFAQVDDSTKSAARTLGEEGLRLEQQGDFSHALEKFEQAEALVPVPTLSLHTAMCLEKIGRVVEASERYLRAISLPIDTTAPPAYQQAQNAAKLEATRLRTIALTRVAHLHLVVSGEPESLVIDERSYPAALVGTSIPLDPGSHHVTVKGATSTSLDVTLADGEDKTVALSQPASPPPPPPPTPLPPPPLVSPPPPPPSIWRPVGFATLGVGTATLVAGVVTYAFALSQASELANRCPNQTCDTSADPTLASGVSSYDAMRTTCAVLLVAGAIVSATGAVLVLASPRHRVTAALGPLGVMGTF